MLDATVFDEFLATTFFIDNSTMPRMLVLWKSPSGRLPRSFYTDQQGEATAASTMRAFLQRVASGEDMGEYEGYVGFPARFWRKAKGYVPPLALLDVLPRFTFVSIFGVFALWLLWKIAVYGLDDDDFRTTTELARAADRARKAQ